jgi:hypothetical protein
MKFLTIRRLMLVLGIALGLLVVWATATPKDLSVESLIGGWYPMYGYNCCDDVFPDDWCSNSQGWGPWGPMVCNGGGLITCILAANPPTVELCSATGPVRCYTYPPSWCNDIHDAQCK